MENLIQQHKSMHWNPLIQEIQAKDHLISELQRAVDESRSQLKEISLALNAAAGSAPICGATPKTIAFINASKDTTRTK